jgi:glycosyltransferase involved in cell wall biosynthesis
LSVGIPVVANDIGGWTKVIEQEEIGVLTESTPEAFGKGVLQLLQNPEMRYELGKRCLELSKTKFNIDRIAMLLKEQYHRLI